MVYMFELAVHCWLVFEETRASEYLMSQFLAAIQHRSLFSNIIDRTPPALCQYISIDVADNCCTAGHDLKELIVRRFFNCMAKHLLFNTYHQWLHETQNQNKPLLVGVEV